MNKKSEDRGSGKGFGRREGQRDKENRGQGQGRGEGASRHGWGKKDDGDSKETDYRQQVQAERVQESEAAAYREQVRAERDQQGGDSDYRRQIEAQQAVEAAKKTGCLPKLFMLVMSFAAVGAAIFLRS